MAEMYARLAGPAGYRTDIAPELPNDLLVGAMIYRLLYDGAPPSSDEVQGMVDVILDGIRRRAGRALAIPGRVARACDSATGS